MKSSNGTIDRINEIASYPATQTQGTATTPPTQLDPNAVILQQLLQNNPSIVTAYKNIKTRIAFQDALQLFLQYAGYQPSSSDAVSLITNASKNLGRS